MINWVFQLLENDGLLAMKKRNIIQALRGKNNK